MSTHQIISYKGFYQVKEAFTQEEIQFLLHRWEEIPLLHEIDHNDWDRSSPGKTSLSNPHRKVVIHGIQKGSIEFLSDRIKYLFSLFIDKDFGIEGPHYFTQYLPGSFHALHTDYQVENGVQREWVMTIQLSDPHDYTGGELIIEGTPAPKDKGSVIIYDGTLLHEVTQVTAGVRYSITECAGREV